MKYDKLDPSAWRGRSSSIALAASRGFNINAELPHLLRSAYPDLAPFDFGFFTEKDVPSRLIDGWVFLRKQNFPDYESFNDAVGLRFGVTLDGDKIKSRNNFIMVMPKQYREEEFLPKILEAEDNAFFSNVHTEETETPHEPGGGHKVMFSDDFKEADTLEELVGTPKKRGRGRPKGSTNKPK